MGTNNQIQVSEITYTPMYVQLYICVVMHFCNHLLSNMYQVPKPRIHATETKDLALIHFRHNMLEVES